MPDIAQYTNLINELAAQQVTLIAVSKTKPVSDILSLYESGQRDFGENYVQELVEKQAQLPPGIRWHFIGHLQSNKVKYISPFVHLIHGIDSLKLLKEVDKQAVKNERIIDCLLQIHIATEETKFGFNEEELLQALDQSVGLDHVRVTGLMGMASFTEDEAVVRGEFHQLHEIFRRLKSARPHLPLDQLSMGMSADFRIAIAEGSTMVRIGSLIFGKTEH